MSMKQIIISIYENDVTKTQTLKVEATEGMRFMEVSGILGQTHFQHMLDAAEQANKSIKEHHWTETMKESETPFQ